jgi:sugar O-acyltransferase (sialic acid O-acetyltransferase NeuD family)
VVPVLGLGAGGHAKVIIELLRATGGYEVIGLLDSREDLHGTEVLGIRVLGGDELLPEYFNQNVRCAFIGMGTVGDTTARRRLYEKVLDNGFECARAIHPQALVSASAAVGLGPTIMAGAVVNAGTRLGDNVIVNTGAIVEHDCTVGSHAHIATGAHVGGGVCIGEGAHVGIGATIRQGIVIGRGAIVGAGAVVVRQVPDSVTVVGVPADILKR